MANLSVLFGQVSGRGGWVQGCGRGTWAGVPSATDVTCVPWELGVRRRGYDKPLPAAKWESRRCCPFPGTPCLPHTDFNPPPQVVRGLSAGTRVFEYMTLSPCIPLSGGHCIPREHLRGSITFHNVCFRLASVGAGVFLCGLRAGEGACLGTCGSMSPSK